MLIFIFLAMIFFGMDAFGAKLKGIAFTPLAWMCLTVALLLHLNIVAILGALAT